MILSAHCILKKFNEKNIIKDLEKNVCIFGNQIPVWHGKKLPRDIYGVIFQIKKL